MIRIQDAYLSTEDFDFQINKKGIVQLSFGPTHICMTLDSAHALQYRLAEFLAHQELIDYPKDEELAEKHLIESKQNLEYLASYRNSK